ncbi:MerR family transcriptional regulator [Thermocatellispora tengchongensis]|uniref:MerR family transcriptional regulator n=1 Tax=Thermocatellispora tengchongensis TaxID=1073253 RepID=UPI00362D231F
MSETWTITELAEHAAGVLRAAPAPGATGAQEAARQLNGRVREVPGERLIRWYTTIGLVDPPLTRRGRIALYGRRHLLQLVAIKRLQASGRSIADIQAELSGATDAHLAHVAGLPAATDPAPTPPTRRDRFWTSPHPVDTHTAADIRTGGDVRQGADVRAATDTWDNISGTGRPHATRGAGEHPASLGHRDGEERPAPAQDHAGNARDLDGHGHTEPARPGGRTGTGPADLGGTGRLHAAREPGEHPAPPGHRDSEERPAPARDSSGAPRAGERTTPAGDRDGEGRLFAGGRRGGGEWAVPGGGRSGEERPIGPLPPLGGTPPIAPLPTVVPRRERGPCRRIPGSRTRCRPIPRRRRRSRRPCPGAGAGSAGGSAAAGLRGADERRADLARGDRAAGGRRTAALLRRPGRHRRGGLPAARRAAPPRAHRPRGDRSPARRPGSRHRNRWRERR